MKKKTKKSGHLKTVLALVLTPFVAIGIWYLITEPIPNTLSGHVPYDPAAFTSALDGLRAQGAPAGEIEKTINDTLAKDSAALPLATEWVRRQSIGQRDNARINSLYFMLYSDLAYKTAERHQRNRQQAAYIDQLKTSFVSLLTFENLVMSDAARCKNDKTYILFMPLIAERLHKTRHVYAYFDARELETVWQLAGDADLRMDGRPPNPEVCADAQYLSDDAWQAKRGNVRFMIEDAWKQRYAEYQAMTSNPIDRQFQRP